MAWLRISLETSGELAEAVADVLARSAPGGVIVESSQPGQSGLQETSRACVTAYLPIDEQTASRRKAIEEGLWHLSQIATLPAAEYATVEAEDWSETWKQHYRPIPIGERLLIVPSWVELPPTHRLPLILDPGMAFGTGTHPSTQQCLLALEKHMRPGMRVIDLGCGSGILAIAAARLGAAEVRALDIDPLAVEATRENCVRNGVADRVAAEIGSLTELAADRPAAHARADLLVANILAPVLVDLLSAGLAEEVVPGGLVVLSGILEEQLPSVLQHSEAAGLRLVEVLSAEDWRTPVLRNATAPSALAGSGGASSLASVAR